MVNCISHIEDVDFLNDAVGRYSPVLVKDLLMDRVNHKMEQIKVISNSTIGINQKQIDLCNVVHEGFAILLSDLELMEDSQVIGDDTYDNTMKGFISEFASLTETFNREFEFLKLPDLTKDTPDALLEIKVIDSPSFNIVKSKLSASLKMYQSDVKKYDSTEKKEKIRILAQTTVRNLEDITSRATALTESVFNYRVVLHDILVEFKQTVDMFYRQFLAIL